MKYSTLLTSVCVLSVVGASVRAEDATDSKWRIGASYRAMFNLDASFKNKGTAPARNNPSVTGKSYSDGYVGTDNLGNAGGLTTYWGYDRPDQAAGNAIAMRNSQSGSLGEDNNAWANGFELTLGRELGQGENVKWGWEGGFSYARLNVHSSQTAQAGVLSLDAFPFGAVPPPLAPYDGTRATGPGLALLGTTPGTAPLSVSSMMNADIYGFRTGPYFEFPLAKRVSLTFGGGLSLGVIDSEVSFTESASAPYSSLAQSTRGSHADMVVGGYASGQINIKLAERWDVFTGIQFHALSHFEQSAGDKAARLDLGSAFAWLVGVQYRF